MSATRAAMTGVVVAVRPTVFKKEQALTPEMLRAAYEVIDKNHPAAKAATARARSGKIEGTAMMALEAGDQTAGSMLRGIELLMKGDLNPAANQFGVALRNAPDAPIASFFLGACYAAAGRDKEAVVGVGARPRGEAASCRRCSCCLPTAGCGSASPPTRSSRCARRSSASRRTTTSGAISPSRNRTSGCTSRRIRRSCRSWIGIRRTPTR